MFDPEFIEACVKSGRVNFGGSWLTIDRIELILEVLRRRPDLQIEGVGGVGTILEIGAYLANIGGK
jgi:hypothetical protein